MILALQTQIPKKEKKMNENYRSKQAECPKCGAMWNAENKNAEANFVHVCKECGSTFIDRKWKEPALEYYYGRGRIKLLIHALIMPFSLIFLAVWFYTSGYLNTVIAGSLTAVALWMAWRAIKSYGTASNTVRMAYLETGNGLPDDVKQSLLWLNSREKLDIYRASGFEVPELFYRRLEESTPAGDETTPDT